MAEPSPSVSPGFAWRTTPAGRILVSTALEQVAPHLFSTRDVVSDETLQPDYDAVGAVFRVEAANVARVRQVHGRGVHLARAGDEGLRGPLVDADVVVTTEPGQVVSVRVADCVPILLADRRRRAVAAVHAGWRGTSAGVVGAAVEALEAAGVPASDLVAAIGPSIGPCCYQVDAMVRDDFAVLHSEAERWFTADGPGRYRLDLWAANRTQLETAGVPARSIHLGAACTADTPECWCSHRRDGAAAGRMVAAIQLEAG